MMDSEYTTLQTPAFKKPFRHGPISRSPLQLPPSIRDLPPVTPDVLENGVWRSTTPKDTHGVLPATPVLVSTPSPAQVQQSPAQSTTPISSVKVNSRSRSKYSAPSSDSDESSDDEHGYKAQRRKAAAVRLISNVENDSSRVGRARPPRALINQSGAAPVSYGGNLRLEDFSRRRRVETYRATGEQDVPPAPQDLVEHREPVFASKTEDAVRLAALVERFRLWETLEQQSIKEADQKRKSDMQALSGRVTLTLSTESEARADLIAKSEAMLQKSTDLDLSLLLSSLGSANPVWGRFKNDPQVAALTRRALELDALMQKLKSLVEEEKVTDIEQLFATKGHEMNQLSSRPEVKDACALRQKDAERRAALAAAEAKAREEAAAEQRRKEEQEKKSKADKDAEERQRAEAEALRNKLKAERKGNFVEMAKERVESLLEPARMVKEVLESTDPFIKATRMEFKKLFLGSFNKISTDRERIESAILTIIEGGRIELAKAEQNNWGERARTFYMYSVADQIVKRAEGEQFDARDYEQAFLNSCVAVDIAAVEPKIGEFILGLLQRECKFMIPQTVVDTTSTSDADYRAALGLRPDETVEKYAKRMKRLVVMAAAMAQTPVEARGNAPPGPHLWPLSEAWVWVARLLNQLRVHAEKGKKMPMPTGPVLDGFFRILGYELQRAYGRQFNKLLAVTEKEIVPLLEERSKVPHLLDAYIREVREAGGKAPKPKGREELERIYRKY